MIDINQFIKLQLEEWQQASDNFQALKSVRTKIVSAPESDNGSAPWMTMVQFNPARIVSTGAKMDATSIKKRPCFLCEKNRPIVQSGLPWGDYTILINPFPIFPKHLTIPANEHVDQAIAGRVADMARLAIDLPGFVIFYNGKRCGASAPDHMHFQAGNIDFLPMVSQIGEVDYIQDGIGLPQRKDMLPGMIVVDAKDADAAQQKFDIAISHLPVPDGDIEPMLNVLCWTTPTGVRLVIIPRKKHRPDCYGSEEGQLLVSPASVDLSGVLITPLEKDFESIDYAAVKSLMEELCYSPAEIKSILEKTI